MNLCKVGFIVKSSRKNVTLFVSGNCEQLGKWDTDKALPLEFNLTNKNWVSACEIYVNRREAFEYKLFAKTENEGCEQIVWDSVDPNRKYVVQYYNVAICFSMDKPQEEVNIIQEFISSTFNPQDPLPRTQSDRGYPPKRENSTNQPAPSIKTKYSFHEIDNKSVQGPAAQQKPSEEMVRPDSPRNPNGSINPPSEDANNSSETLKEKMPLNSFLQEEKEDTVLSEPSKPKSTTFFEERLPIGSVHSLQNFFKESCFVFVTAMLPIKVRKRGVSSCSSENTQSPEAKSKDNFRDPDSSPIYKSQLDSTDYEITDYFISTSQIYYYIQKYMHLKGSFIWAGCLVFEETPEEKARLKSFLLETRNFLPIYISKSEFEIAHMKVYKEYFKRIFTTSHIKLIEEITKMGFYDIEKEWSVFEAVNKKMAYGIADYIQETNSVKTRPTFVLINELMGILIPQYFIQRNTRPLRISTSYYFHTVFPPLNQLKKTPKFKRLFMSLLSCDMVLFNSNQQANNFLKSSKDLFLLDIEYDRGASIVLNYKGRKIFISILALGIERTLVASTQNVEKKCELIYEMKAFLRNRVFIFSNEHADYEVCQLKLSIYEYLIKTYPDIRDKVFFLFCITCPLTAEQEKKILQRAKEINELCNQEISLCNSSKEVEVDMEPTQWKSGGLDQPSAGSSPSSLSALPPERERPREEPCPEKGPLFPLKVLIKKNLEKYRRVAYLELTDICFEVAFEERVNLYTLEYKVLRRERGKMIVDDQSNSVDALNYNIKKENPMNIAKFCKEFYELITFLTNIDRTHGSFIQRRSRLSSDNKMPLIDPETSPLYSLDVWFENLISDLKQAKLNNQRMNNHYQFSRKCSKNYEILANHKAVEPILLKKIYQDLVEHSGQLIVDMDGLFFSNERMRSLLHYKTQKSEYMQLFHSIKAVLSPHLEKFVAFLADLQKKSPEVLVLLYSMREKKLFNLLFEGVVLPDVILVVEAGCYYKRLSAGHEGYTSSFSSTGRNDWVDAVRNSIENYSTRYNLFSTRYHHHFIELSVIQKESELAKDLIDSMVTDLTQEIESEEVKLVILKGEGCLLIVPAALSPTNVLVRFAKMFWDKPEQAKRIYVLGGGLFEPVFVLASKRSNQALRNPSSESKNSVTITVSLQDNISEAQRYLSYGPNTHFEITSKKNFFRYK